MFRGGVRRGSVGAGGGNRPGRLVGSSQFLKKKIFEKPVSRGAPAPTQGEAHALGTLPPNTIHDIIAHITAPNQRRTFMPRHLPDHDELTEQLNYFLTRTSLRLGQKPVPAKMVTDFLLTRIEQEEIEPLTTHATEIGAIKLTSNGDYLPLPKYIFVGGPE